jgi:two-component system sensor histidine kinase KdpD
LRTAEKDWVWGLAICRAIVEAHGGTIRYDDNVPKGSVFTFTIPMEDSE